MNPDWRALAGESRVDDEHLSFNLEGGRSHRVQVIEYNDGWKLSAPVASATTLRRTGVDGAELWRRNRYLNLGGYVLDVDGNVRVTALLPFVGATAVEFVEVARLVAVEADRMEYYLTGHDIH